MNVGIGQSDTSVILRREKTKENCVSIRFVDVNHNVIEEYFIPELVSGFGLLPSCFWVHCIACNYDSADTYDRIAYVDGLHLLPALSCLQVGFLGNGDNSPRRLFPLERWPKPDELLRNVTNLSFLPRLLPFQSFPAENAYVNTFGMQGAFLKRLHTFFVQKTWRYLHGELLDKCVALAPFELPLYVLLWTFDWLPNVAVVEERKKVALLTFVLHSCSGIRQIDFHSLQK